MRRHRISDDIIILILENLDPASLWRACKAFRRIHAIVMEFQSLRYQYELALSGMKDGPAPYRRGTALIRLQLLASYKKDWPTLSWSREDKIRIPTPAHVGSSGGFIHQIQLHHDFQCTLDLTELPSYRTRRPLSQFRHITHPSPPIENVAIDSSQGLLVATHVFSYNGLTGIQVHLRDLWTFSRHPKASAISCDFNTQSKVPVSHLAIHISGGKLGISMAFIGGKVKHLLMDWRTLDARWDNAAGIQFLDENHMLVLNKHEGQTIFLLYDITNVGKAVPMREYELPPIWNNSTVAFSPNTSTRSANLDALFYPDPAARILVLTATPSKHSKNASRNWLVINESFFRRPFSRRDTFQVQWSHWSQYCFVRTISPTTTFLRGPYVAGKRILFLDSDPIHRSATDSPTRLNLIDFVPITDTIRPASRAWTWVGPRTNVVAIESSINLPNETVNYLDVDGIRVTDDNIVLFIESQQGSREINVLTFGGPPARY